MSPIEPTAPVRNMGALAHLGDGYVGTQTPAGGLDYVAPLAGLRFRVYAERASGRWTIYADYAGWTRIHIQQLAEGVSLGDAGARTAQISRWLFTLVRKHA